MLILIFTQWNKRESLLWLFYIDNTMLVNNVIFLPQQMKKTLEFEFEMTNLKYIHFCIGIQMIRNQEDGWIRMS
jgi:hypothetical protein